MQYGRLDGFGEDDDFGGNDNMDVDEFGGNRRARPAPRNLGQQTTREADLNAAI